MVIARKHKEDVSNLNSQVQYLTIPWTTQNSNKYIEMIENINELCAIYIQLEVIVIKLLYERPKEWELTYPWISTKYV